MPSYRRSRRPTYRRKSNTAWYDRKYNAQQLALKAWKGVKYIKGLVNSERMYKDISYSVSTAIPSTGFVTHLTAVAQGDTDAARTGNSILLRSLTYRYRIEVNASVTSNTGVTMVVFFDKQQLSDTAPSVTDVLTASTVESLYNVNTIGRFQILSRQTFILTPASGARPALELVKTFNLNKHVRYNGGNSTDIQKNGLYIMFVASEAVNTPVISGTGRIGYHDN